MQDNFATGPTVLSRHQIRVWRNSIFIIFALCGIGLASWVARVPTVKAQLAISTTEMGALLFAIAAGSILGLVASSHLLVRFGARTIIAASFVTAPLGLSVAGLAVTLGPYYWITFAGLAIYGLGTATCDVAMNLSGAVNERHLGRTVMPVFHAFFSFGTMIGAGLGALAELWHVTLAAQTVTIALALAATGLVAVRFTQPETILPGTDSHETGANVSDIHADPAPAGWRARLAIWRDPRTLLLGLVVLGMAFAEGSAGDWLSLAAVEGHGVDRPTGAVVLGVFVTAMTVGRLAGPRVLDRYGRVLVLRVSAGVAALGLLAFITIPVLWIAVVGVVLWGLGSALGFPTGMSAAADDPSNAAARVSAVATIGYTAFLIGPPLIGFLGEHFGVLHSLLVVLVLIVVAGVASGAARDRSRS